MDVAAQNAMLDAAYGVNRAAHCPASHELALFIGDPADGGVEITDGGYARVTVAAADWEPAADGEKSTIQFQMADATGAWSGEASYWGLLDGADLWDSGPLVEPLVVTGPGDGPLIQVTVRWADAIEADE